MNDAKGGNKGSLGGSYFTLAIGLSQLAKIIIELVELPGLKVQLARQQPQTRIFGLLFVRSAARRAAHTGSSPSPSQSFTRYPKLNVKAPRALLTTKARTFAMRQTSYCLRPYGKDRVKAQPVRAN
jgi:hypothetical protein